MTFFLHLICADPFYPCNFFSGPKTVCMVTCFIVHPIKKIQKIWCFRNYVKTPFANLSIFYFHSDYMSTEDIKKRKWIPRYWTILHRSTLTTSKVFMKFCDASCPSPGMYPAVSFGTPPLQKCWVRLCKQYLVIHLKRLELQTQAYLRKVLIQHFIVFYLKVMK